MKTLKVLSNVAFSAALIAGAVAAPSAFAASSSEQSKSTSVQSQQRQVLADAPALPDGSTPVPPTLLPAPPEPSKDGGPGLKGEKADIIGQIKSINGNQITITAPEKPPLPATDRKVNNTSSSKNTKSSTKTSVSKDTYSKPQGPLPEGTSVTINVYSGTDIVKTSHTPEKGHVETTISLSALNVGDHIAVTLVSDTSKQASKIEIHEAPQPPADGSTPPTPPAPPKDGSTPPAPPVPTDGSTPPTPPAPPVDGSTPPTPSANASNSVTSEESS